MLHAKIIGIGAAGNKAAIKLVENKVVDVNDIILMNSTLKDIPAEYKNSATVIKGSEGCAKNRAKAKSIMLDNLKCGIIKPETILEPIDKMVIIVTSSEGGTGSGASIILAKYFKQVLNANVHVFVFTGFEEDGIGLKNTVDFFNELSKDYTVESISNKKFNKQNKLTAENDANLEFCNRVSILLGNNIVESDQNIDSEDLYKLTTTKGFMTIEHCSLDKIKNVESFNKALIDTIDTSKSLDVEATCKRIGCILNIHQKTKDSIDFLFSVLKERYGMPFEIFTHVQDVHTEEYIDFIVSGLKMPIAEINSVYENFKKSMDAVDKSKDEFFSKEFDTSLDDGLDDFQNTDISVEEMEKNKELFFGNAIKTKNGKLKNIKVSDEL
jgi:hypothetical protein